MKITGGENRCEGIGNTGDNTGQKKKGYTEYE